MARRPALLVAAVLVLAGGVLTEASPAEAPARASASARLALGSLGEIGAVDALGDGQDSSRVSVNRRGLEVAAGRLSVRASRQDGRGSARASAGAGSVSLLGGLVTATGLRRTAAARDGEVTYTGRVEELVVEGRPVGTLTEPEFFGLAEDAGSVAVNRAGRALTVSLTRARNGFPAGTRVTVGMVSAAASDGAAPGSTPTPTPTPTATRTPAPTATATPKPERAKKKKKTTRATRRAAPEVPTRLTDDRFAFPVHGESTVGGPFGAERQIGAHQGNDVFAPFGAPVLAVTDGELFSVGTLPISGNRLWLRSKAGDEFFYAHLSAFSKLAVNGRRVRAGDVLGFTGNTGDAEPTPPHVHFEIHPGGGDAVDPQPILEAWRDRRDVPPGAWLTRYGSDMEQRPGALVEVRDFIAGE